MSSIAMRTRKETRPWRAFQSGGAVSGGTGGRCAITRRAASAVARCCSMTRATSMRGLVGSIARAASTMKAETDMPACDARALILSQSSSVQESEYLPGLFGRRPHGSVSVVFMQQRTSSASSTDMSRSGTGAIRRVTTSAVAEEMIEEDLAFVRRRQQLPAIRFVVEGTGDHERRAAHPSRLRPPGDDRLLFDCAVVGVLPGTVISRRLSLRSSARRASTRSLTAFQVSGSSTRRSRSIPSRQAERVFHAGQRVADAGVVGLAARGRRGGG